MTSRRKGRGGEEERRRGYDPPMLWCVVLYNRMFSVFLFLGRTIMISAIGFREEDGKE